MSPRAKARVSAVAVLLLALALRLWGLQAQSLSMDEVAELRIAHGTPGQIVRAQDGFPPLYHSILHAWLTVFPTDQSARWLSALLGTAAVMIVWGLARRAGGERVGLWTAVLVAVSPFQIWHAQEGRAYILYYLLAAGAFWSFFTALETDSRRAWAAYVAIAWAGLLTHYYFFLLVLADLLILLAERAGRSPRRAVAAHAVLAVLSLPVLWLVRGDLAAEAGSPFANASHPAAIGYSLFAFVAGYAIGPSARQLHELDARQAVASALPWLLLAGGTAGVLLVYGLRVLGGRLWGGRLLLATVLPVVLSVILAAVAGVTFQVRHVVWASIPLMVVLGAGCSAWRGRPLVGAALAGLLILFGVARYHRQFVAEYRNEDLRGLASFLRSTPPAPVMVLSGYMAEPVRYYLGDGWRVEGLPDAGGGLRDALGRADSLLPSGGPFWLVYTREFHGDPQGRLLDTLVHLRRLRRVERFAGISLYAGDGKAVSGP